MKDIKITNIYDDYIFDDRLETDHGISCLIEGLEKTILFDTGQHPEIFKRNIEKLGIDISKIDLVILSHSHYDHAGGFPHVAKTRKDLPVYIPDSFFNGFIKANPDYDRLLIIPIKQGIEIFSGTYSTGEAGSDRKEHSLLFKTDKGLVIVTGCAHQGLIEIIESVKSKFSENIFLVVGGFHLCNMKESEFRTVINKVKELKIKYVAPSHCTGKEAIKYFKKIFQETFIQTGAGKVIKLKELM
ncbi:MBL fold metallo-hydrolase [Candidatus Dependentiae bacterium]|nr:MBL fold metallo-hydrolase [Candidatus Dependentiae bacterium]